TVPDDALQELQQFRIAIGNAMKEASKQWAILARTSRRYLGEILPLLAAQHFACAKVNVSNRCFEQPRIGVPLLDSRCMAAICSGEPFDCGDCLCWCQLHGDPRLGIAAFGTGSPADGAA